VRAPPSAPADYAQALIAADRALERASQELDDAAPAPATQARIDMSQPLAPAPPRASSYRIHPPEAGAPWRADVFVRGAAVGRDPMLNKGTAFPPDERDALGLHGLVPAYTSTIDEQLVRIKENYARLNDDLDRYLYLVALQDRNETLFYRFGIENLEAVLPVVYTPTVGRACQEYSHIYRQPRGVYVTPEDVHRIDEILEGSGYGDVALLVVTDGERILGTGDQGAGGIGISIGKLTLYTLGAGFHPTTTLPVVLDCGTDSDRLLRDPMYLGRRERRVRGERYLELLDAFVDAVHRRWPRAIVQWEDLAKHNAFAVLDRYRDRVPSFNDDILGTGAVVLSALTNAFQIAGVPMRDARVLFLGAGEACIGSARALLASKLADGASTSEAKDAMAFLDTHGLVTADRPGLEPFKAEFALRPELAWPAGPRDRALLDAVDHFRPHAVVGATGVAGTFHEDMVRAFAAQTARPILLALSNPSANTEAVPSDLHTWSQGRALIATGSPFPPVPGPTGPIPIAQANNMLVFPGVGLGAWVSHAGRVTNEMFAVAARAVAACVPPERRAQGVILPTVGEIRRVSRAVALAVALEAVHSGEASEATPEELAERLDRATWWPDYMELAAAEE
jgi:malic enzyme